MIRKATEQDLAAVAAIYERIVTREQQGLAQIGWLPGVYPVAATAEAALARGDLFVLEAGGCPAAAAIINQIQVDAYALGQWRRPARAEEVCVLHTLVVDPTLPRQGLGRRFVAFYEDYARRRGWPCLRMDTNAKNTVARAFYRKLGYEEIGIVPCVFNGIPDVDLVLLEKEV